MEAMIFAAGLGTRLKPLTDQRPKALIEINGISLLERNIKKLSESGIKKIVINVHHFSDMMKKYIKQLSLKFDTELIVSDESSLLLDTGGGLLKAKKYFSGKENILLHNVDILSDISFNDMEQYFTRSNTNALVCIAVSKRKTSRYFVFDESGSLSGWCNVQTDEKKIIKPSIKETLLAFSGIHIIKYGLFDKIRFDNKFSITDLYLDLCKDNIIIPYLHQGRWVDVGKKESIPVAKELF